MPPQIRLSPSQVADLAEIRDTPPATLAAITQRLQSVTPPPMRPKDLQREISQIIGNDKPEAVNRIMRPLLALQLIIQKQRLDVGEALEAIRLALKSSDPPWNNEEFEKWRQVELAFRQMLQLPAVRRVSTSLDLMYEHENLFHSSRVITDIRPVFSEDASNIDASVISLTLRIHYSSADGDHTISIVMDERDIQELERQCQRALKKSQTARRIMTDKASVPTVITGDSGNA